MPNRKTGLLLLLAIFAATEIWAATLTNYAAGDVLLCFRKSGGGNNDLVVDVGPATTLTNLSVNYRLSITNYTGIQLAAVGTNAVSWSAFTWFSDDTIFMSKARKTIYTQSTPWATLDSPALLVTDMQPVPKGASSNLGTDVRSSATAVIEPEFSGDYLQGYSYHDAVLGSGGQDPSLSGDSFGGDFPGNPELTTSNNFTISGNILRSDFYLIPPSGSVILAGLFELSTNGAMTYVAYPTRPIVQTLAATSITAAAAQLNCTVNPTNDNSSLFFQYGLTTSYGSTTISTNIGTTSGTYNLSASSLAAGTQYHFRVAAYNDYGTNFGGDQAFSTTTSSLPAVPVITFFSRTNNLTTIAYTTGNSGTYTFRGTNSLMNAGARTNWPAIASVAGDGLIHTNTDPDTVSNKFYIITAQ